MSTCLDIDLAADARVELPDADLLDLVQRQTFRFFWEGAHPASGLARDRINLDRDSGSDLTTVGGSGFGVMAIIVGAERRWITREEAIERLLMIVDHLDRATCYHGVFPHFMNGRTGATIPFSRKDDGADLVETSLLFQGLLCARQYFARATPEEERLRGRIDWLWRGVEWDWHTRGGLNVLYWHWSPNNGWALNHEIRGWNECLITYVLAAASPTHPIDPEVYHRGYAESRAFLNRRSYYGIELPLGIDYGGPLFFTQYSFMGLDPRGLKDRYADYWEQNVRHTLINYEHCARNPLGHKGYSSCCWGLTASDNAHGYAAHAPYDDQGVIAPTAAIGSIPYAPEHSSRALRHFFYDMGSRIWDKYGFTSSFSVSENWYSRAYLAIDQGPIVCMVENYRTGLLWNLFMSAPEIRTGLKRLDFTSPHFD